VKRSDDAALAPNWTRVLLTDAALGILGILAGVGTAVRGNGVIGSILVGAGAAYLVLVALRYRRWKAMRDEAGITRPRPG
jgi:hypothetical protein